MFRNCTYMNYVVYTGVKGDCIRLSMYMQACTHIYTACRYKGTQFFIYRHIRIEEAPLFCYSVDIHTHLYVSEHSQFMALWVLPSGRYPVPSDITAPPDSTGYLFALFLVTS